MTHENALIVDRRHALTGAAAVAAGGAAALAGAEGASAAYRVNRRTLRKGDRNDDVLYFQRKARQAGFYPGKPDGIYGFQTQQVAWAVQKAYGLVRDGVVGQKTWLKVIRQPQIKVRTTSGTRIEVDLDRQLLFYIKSGELQEIHNTSTGNGEGYEYRGKYYPHARTPRGTWGGMWNEDDGWRNGELGSMWRPYFFAAGGYAIHGSRFIPPYPDSHGCVRLSIKAMNHLISIGAMRWNRDTLIYGTGPNQDPEGASVAGAASGSAAGGAPQHVVDLRLKDVRSTI
ncbi:L,D-transpeptidase family protein [Kytococcus sp. Marseille-QA3725]